MADIVKHIGQAAISSASATDILFTTPVPASTKLLIHVITLTVKLSSGSGNFGIYHVRSGGSAGETTNIIRVVAASTTPQTIECGTGVVLVTGDKLQVKNIGSATVEYGCVDVSGVEIT